jgi:hypothetical protein
MARTDPPLNTYVPQFVHDDLGALIDALAAEGAGKTNLVAALVHAATVAKARTALRRYKVDEVAFRRQQRESVRND